MLKKFSVIITVLFVSACSSNARMHESSNDYKYDGEKYGKVNVIFSEKVTESENKTVVANQLTLDFNIQNFLSAKNAYDETSTNEINVVVNKVHMRNAFNAIMFGFLSGADSIDGTVTLVNQASNEKTFFDVSATYALGGFVGGQNENRIRWLSEAFSEVIANAVVSSK